MPYGATMASDHGVGAGHGQSVQAPEHRDGLGAVAQTVRPIRESICSIVSIILKRPVRMAGERVETVGQIEIAGLIAFRVHDDRNRGYRPPAFEGAAQSIDQQYPAESAAAKALIDGHPPEGDTYSGWPPVKV